MAVYDPSKLSHFVKSQPVNSADSKRPTKEIDFASGLNRVRNENPSLFQNFFNNLNLSKIAHKQAESKSGPGFPSKKYAPYWKPSLLKGDSINRRFVTL